MMIDIIKHCNFIVITKCSVNRNQYFFKYLLNQIKFIDNQ